MLAGARVIPQDASGEICLLQKYFSDCRRHCISHRALQDDYSHRSLSTGLSSSTLLSLPLLLFLHNGLEAF